MAIIKIATQAELDALANSFKEWTQIELRGKKFVVKQRYDNAIVVAWGSSHVVAWGSSHVEAWGSSHVEARESSHVVARGSSHVVAWGSSHVVAWGSSHVVAWGSSHVVASQYVAIHKHSDDSTITGSGVVIAVKQPENPTEWCDFYGAKVVDNIATLYKAVDENYKSGYGFTYAPGTSPEAPDWDGGRVECGGGLHFCAHPLAALGYHSGATKFVACPVALEDIAVHKNATMPNKIKARRICGPIVECDRYGNPLS